MMNTAHTLIYGGLTLVGLSILSVWLSAREPEPDGLFAMIWKVLAAALSISGTMTWVMVPVALNIRHVRITEFHFILFAVLLVLMLLWSMSRMIVLKMELT